MSLLNPIVEEDLVKEVPVTLLVDGNPQDFVLREAMGRVSTLYVNAKAKIYIANGEGRIIGFKDPANLQPLLVGGCLFRVKNGEAEKKSVGENWVENNIGHSMKEKLFNRALDLSGLRETDGSLATLFQELFELPEISFSIEKLVEVIDNHPEGDTKFSSIRALLVPDAEKEAKNS